MKSHKLSAISACIFTFGLAAQAQAAPVSGQGTWETTLQGRDLDGNTATIEAYYDEVLEITWLADANLAGSNTFGVGGINANGIMNWAEANQWIAAMNADGGTGYLGYNNWRLPTLAPINGSSFNIDINNNGTSDRGYADSDGWVDGSGNPVSEMGHMYYVNLGNLGFCTPDNFNPTSCTEQSGWGLSNTGRFANLQASDYWFGTEFNANDAWDFAFVIGAQDAHTKSNNRFAWAVQSGDIGTAVVPLPAAAWLFASGLIGLIGIAKRKAAYIENNVSI